MNKQRLPCLLLASGAITLLSGSSLMLPTLANAKCGSAADGGRGADYDLFWHTVDGGAVMFGTDSDFELSGTIGQPGAGTMTGGEFTLTGGFWFEVPQGDCNSTGNVDLLDYDEFESCLAGPDTGVAVGCECFDVNRSGAVDLGDFAVVQTAFTGS